MAQAQSVTLALPDGIAGEKLAKKEKDLNEKMSKGPAVEIDSKIEFLKS